MYALVYLCVSEWVSVSTCMFVVVSCHSLLVHLRQGLSLILRLKSSQLGLKSTIPRNPAVTCMPSSSLSCRCWDPSFGSHGCAANAVSHWPFPSAPRYCHYIETLTCTGSDFTLLYKTAATSHFRLCYSAYSEAEHFFLSHALITVKNQWTAKTKW